MMAKTIDILLVEDNAADVEITKQGFKQAGIPTQLHVVHNGSDAVAFLRTEAKFADAPRPDLVLLDLNLPGMNGRDVLRTIKSDQVLNSIPVVVLSSTKSEDEIVSAYQLHANAVMTKPMDFRNFVAMVESISAYWFELVNLPR